MRNGLVAKCLPTVIPTGDLPQADKILMRYYVYILRSLKNGDIYVGSTENLQKRLLLHNAGRVKSTKGYRPWELLTYEEFGTRSEAFQREHFLKTGQQKEKLKNKYGLVVK